MTNPKSKSATFSGNRPLIRAMKSKATTSAVGSKSKVSTHEDKQISEDDDFMDEPLIKVFKRSSILKSAEKRERKNIYDRSKRMHDRPQRKKDNDGPVSVTNEGVEKLARAKKRKSSGKYGNATKKKKPTLRDSKTKEEEQALVEVLKRNKLTFGWSLADIRGISPTTCMHQINLEEGARPKRDG